MKNLKLIVIASTIAVLAITTLSVALAHNYVTNPYYSVMMGDSIPFKDNKWWIEMEERIGHRWSDVVDEEWFDEMRSYMEEHFEEVKTQEWYDEMAQFMEDRLESQGYEYIHGDYQRGYARGCWGW